MNLIFLGAPGAGKGTQAEIVSEKFNIPAVSTGNIIREAMKNGTEMGTKAQEFVQKGELVPDDVVIGIIKERLQESDCANGFILDGFPRTIPQAEALDKMGVVIDKVIDIENCYSYVRQTRLPELRCKLSHRIQKARKRRCLQQLRQRAYHP